MALPKHLTAVIPAQVGGFAPSVLTGTWFVTRSTLSMWRTWNAPSITYSVLPGGQIIDTVQASYKGKERLIVGLDTQQAAPGTFQWRGVTPLTYWAVSRWQVAAYDPQAQWMVTVFKRTLFTAPGLDICTRSPYLLPDLERPLLDLLGTLPLARPFLPRLFAPRQLL